MYPLILSINATAYALSRNLTGSRGSNVNTGRGRDSIYLVSADKNSPANKMVLNSQHIYVRVLKDISHHENNRNAHPP